MSRNKKILVGLGVVVVLGGIAFANIKFKRQDGIVVNVETIQKRDLQAIVSASGKIQPQRPVNISADTMGRVTDWRSKKADACKKGQFLLQIDPRNLTTAYNQTEASLAAARSQMEQLRVVDRRHQGVAEAGAGRLHAPAAAVQGRADAERGARQRREPGADAAGRAEARRSGRSRRSGCG